MEMEKEDVQKINNIIKRSLKNNSFEIYYQPIYDNKEKRFRSAEALIRCNDPEYEYISPELLITVAEKNGHIDRITDVVYESVCRFISENNLKKYGIDFIEINLSPENCKQKNLIEKLTEIRKRYRIPASMINLEITETSSIQGNVAIEDTLLSICNDGTKLSIDDYGMGFATSSYLIKIPASIVKIDKHILWVAMNDHAAMFILKSTIKMLIGLEKKVVIEGVETKQMVEALNQISGELFYQGFYYSKPIKGHHFIKFLKRKNILPLQTEAV